MNGTTASAPVKRLPIQHDFSGESRREAIQKLRARVASDIEALKQSSKPEAAEELKEKQMILIAYNKMLKNSPAMEMPAPASAEQSNASSSFSRLKALLEKPDWNVWDSVYCRTPVEGPTLRFHVVKPGFKKRPLSD